MPSINTIKSSPLARVFSYLRQHGIFWLIISASVMAALYAASFHVQLPKYSSPDETVNAVFTRQVALTGRVIFPAGPVADIAHPRSVIVDGENLIPATFIGLPLYYGWVGRIIGWQHTWMITPIFAAVSLVFFFLLIRNIFSFRAAIISTVLLSVNPVYWFYASRGFWHNSIFISWVIIGAYFLWTGLHASRWRLSLAGAALGMALAFRSAEIFWIASFTVVIFFIFRQRLRLLPLLSFIILIALPLLPIIITQQHLFSKPLTGAYDSVVSNKLDVSSNILDRAIAFVAPFGWHPLRALRIFTAYGLQPLFPTLALGLLSAVVILCRRRSPWFWYSLGTIALSSWLVLYYGSFTFREIPLGQQGPNLGSSYLRYWLPMIVAFTPLAAKFLLDIRSYFQGKTGWTVSVLILMAAVMGSVFQATKDPEFGFAVARSNITGEYRRKLSYIIAHTPPNAIIVASLDDKIYWPERQVVGYNYGPIPDKVIRNLPRLAQAAPVFFISALPGEAERVNGILIPSSYHWQLKSTASGIGSLYQLAASREGEAP